MKLANVEYAVADRVARVVMARPQYRNAQSATLLRELDTAFAEAAADPEVRVIVLSGAGEAFSAGHDIGTPDQVAEMEGRRRDITEAEDRFDYSYEMFLDMSLRWRDLPKPTIASVHGWCIFGGWLVASAMDLIVAADDARFLTALLQYFPLPFDVGPRKAKELLFDGHEISAAEALELGFVNKVVPRDRLEEETDAMARRIAGQSAFYLRMAKQAINQAQDAMGFRAAVTGAHAHYMLSEISNRQWSRKQGVDPSNTTRGGRRRLALVDHILQASDRQPQA
ncbi:MAG TPA: enoyl-CoA hydratase-related protein [Acidimicrobiales bacterium]|nr:enoyl-CoA hydratase-related protein [Acidimicrobiales bacterium]